MRGRVQRETISLGGATIIIIAIIMIIIIDYMTLLTCRVCRFTFQVKATSIKVAMSGPKEKDCWLIEIAGSDLRIRPLTRIRSEKKLLTSRLGSQKNWDRKLRPNGEYCWLA